MTTLLQDIQAVLAAVPGLTGGSHYLSNEDQPPTPPYAVFAFVVSTSNNSMDGPSDTQNTRVQIDIFSRSVGELETLDAALDTAMKAAAFTNIPIASQDQFEEPVRLFRRIREFSVWATN